MNNPDIRWVQRLNNLENAFFQLKKAVELSRQRPLTELEIQGLIQAFEFTHELAWNTIKDFFAEKGNREIYGSKDAVREAFQFGLIKNGEVWMDMITSRNKSSHTYNRVTADEITAKILKDYFREFESFIAKLNTLRP